MAYQKKQKEQKEEKINILVNPEELKKFKQTLVTVTHYLELMDQNREAIKETIEEAATLFNIDKKIIRKLSTVMFKHNYADIQEENNHFEMLYEALVGGRISVIDPLEDADKE